MSMESGDIRVPLYTHAHTHSCHHTRADSQHAGHLDQNSHDKLLKAHTKQSKVIQRLQEELTEMRTMKVQSLAVDPHLVA